MYFDLPLVVQLCVISYPEITLLWRDANKVEYFIFSGSSVKPFATKLHYDEKVIKSH